LDYFVQHNGDSALQPAQRSTYHTNAFGAIKFVFLDTAHVAAVDGDQLSWLDQQLQSNNPQTFPVYHVPMFPSHRSPEEGYIPRMLFVR
jgi:hypothetical protein